MLDLAGEREAVVGQPHPIAAGQEQLAPAVLAHGVARIDVSGQLEVDGLVPGPSIWSARMT